MAPPISSAIDFSDLASGTHLCHFYASPQDLLDTLGPLFKAGLEKHEYCLWVVSSSLTTEQAAASLRSGVRDVDRHVSEGNLKIVRSTEWYLEDGKFDAARVTQAWQDQLEGALARGYTWRQSTKRLVFCGPRSSASASRTRLYNDNPVPLRREHQSPRREGV